MARTIRPIASSCPATRRSSSSSFFVSSELAETSSRKRTKARMIAMFVAIARALRSTLEKHRDSLLGEGMNGLAASPPSSEVD